jgi:hypothetical protein
MKSLFLSGGLAGFVVCLLAGLAAGRSIDVILRDSAIGCLVGALLVRWFWLVLLRSFREALTVRRRAAEEAAAAAAAQQNSQAPASPLAARATVAPTAPAAHPAPAAARALPPLAQPKLATR